VQYPSTGYDDELCWAAIWLYKATGTTSYFTEAQAYYADHVDDWGGWGGWAFSWDTKAPALHILLGEMISTNSKYRENAHDYFDNWISGDVPKTPKGLSYRDKWGSSRYAANTAFLAFQYARHLKTQSAPKSSGYNSAIAYNNAYTQYKEDLIYAKTLFAFGQKQIDYILGDGGRSYVAGFGKSYPTFIFHKSSYNSMLYYPLKAEANSVQKKDFYYSERKNTFIPYGAVVGGPIETTSGPTDWWVESRASYIYTESAMDYNSGFTGALAALVEYYNVTNLASDCGLDLGWTFVDGLTPTTWPEDDCYHQCC